ncbi:MAG TPA: trypsin-like peptidase domain-containing protein [Candidatus Hydrogenedentes bacterium]|jgi:serine protease Do|nr:trypsin-like peptidase domain-containing protein [Candidatus Hydrogenedentota bacterium]
MKTERMLVFCACCLAMPAVFAQAQSDLDQSRKNAIVTAIEAVKSSVVTINVLEIREEQVADPFSSDFMGMFDFYFRRPRVQGRVVEGIGTGFLFDAQGHILTNYHVIQDADRIASATLSDGSALDVEVIGADERTDIAVLRVRTDHALPFARLGDSNNLFIGEWVIAIGNPFGTMISDPQPSVSVGVVSANHRRVRREVGGGQRLYQGMIQTDAAINPGNSGGPLVNALGEVVGINTMLFSQSGGDQGLGFAIPINRARRVAEEIIQYGRRRNPWLGFRGEALGALQPQTLQRLNIQIEAGVLVTEILRTCPAYKQGLDVGDIIYAVNGEPVEHPLDIDFINWGLFIGDQVEIDFYHNGAKEKIRFPVEEVSPPEQ